VKPSLHRIPALAVAVAAVAAAALFVAAPPAEAAETCWVVAPEIDVDGDGNPDARIPHPRATLCVNADTGLYDPVSFTCYGGLYSCALRVTAGHAGSAAASSELCVEAYPEVPPLCTTVDTGSIPLIPIGPHTTCVGWGLYPPCWDGEP
jgi:hypothetical protein